MVKKEETNHNNTIDQPYIFTDMENFVKNIEEDSRYNFENRIIYTLELLEII